MKKDKNSSRFIANSDQEAWEKAKRHHMAGKWHVWCADCGHKNHQNASNCNKCEYGNGPGSFGVNNKLNVGRPKYTSDGKKGVYKR